MLFRIYYIKIWRCVCNTQLLLLECGMLRAVTNKSYLNGFQNPWNLEFWNNFSDIIIIMHFLNFLWHLCDGGNESIPLLKRQKYEKRNNSIIISFCFKFFIETENKKSRLLFAIWTGQHVSFILIVCLNRFKDFLSTFPLNDVVL